MPKYHIARIVAVVAALAAVAVGGAAYSGGSSDVYVVQPGDTLWAIAGRSGTTVAALAAANGMRPTDILAIGRHLVIPGESHAILTAATTSYAPVSPLTGSVGVSLSGGTISSSYCASFTPQAGPSSLPSYLADSPSRLALRPLFEEWAYHYGVSPALLEAIAWQESGWQEGVVSGDGAVGVGQVLPSTATFVEQDLIGESLSLTSASDNIRIEAAYVAYLRRNLGSTCDTIAAYYQGLGSMSEYGVLAMSVPYVQDVEYLLPGFE